MFSRLVMMGSRHGVNDPGAREAPCVNKSIRDLIERKGFIPLAPRLTTASFSTLDRSGLAAT
jgi:hypothetical protein